jgi:hypothetical protein
MKLLESPPRKTVDKVQSVKIEEVIQAEDTLFKESTIDPKNIKSVNWTRGRTSLFDEHRLSSHGYSLSEFENSNSDSFETDSEEAIIGETDIDKDNNAVERIKNLGHTKTLRKLH